MEEIRLKDWEEATGACMGVERDIDEIILTIGETCLRFLNDSAEARAIDAAIEADILKPGARVALLRTDIPGKPLVIRITGSGEPTA